MQPHEVAVPIILFIMVGLVIMIGILSRHRERLTMVEKGMSSEDIKSIYSRRFQPNPLSSLKWGILFIFGGLAVLVGFFLHYQVGTDEGVMVGLIPLFLGCGLLLFYILASKKAG